MKEQVRTAMNIPAEANCEFIEVQRLQNSYLQFLNPVSSMADDKTARDADMTHLSTWMLIVD